MTFSYGITNPNKDKILESLLIHVFKTYFLSACCEPRHCSEGWGQREGHAVCALGGGEGDRGEMTGRGEH